MRDCAGIRCGSANKLLYDEVKEKDNMKKKICSIMLVMMLSLSFSSMMASAAEIQPYGFGCTCGGSLNGRRNTYDAWVTYTSVPCEKKPWLYDSKQKRVVHTTYICNKCGTQVTQNSTQYRTLCTH